MAYNPTINATDKIKNTRPQLQENFTEIQDWTSIDHATFGTPNEGKHNQLTFPMTTPGAPVGGEIRLWNDNYAPTAQPELFIANGTSGLNWPFTASFANANGYTFLPGGLLLKWGNQVRVEASPNGGPFIYVFNAAVPFTQILSAWVSVAATNNPGQDVNAIAYATDLATPAQLSYRVWRRNLYNTDGTDHPPYTVFIWAIGLP